MLLCSLVLCSQYPTLQGPMLMMDVVIGFLDSVIPVPWRRRQQEEGWRKSGQWVTEAAFSLEPSSVTLHHIPHLLLNGSPCRHILLAGRPEWCLDLVTSWNHCHRCHMLSHYRDGDHVAWVLHSASWFGIVKPVYLSSFEVDGWWIGNLHDVLVHSVYFKSHSRVHTCKLVCQEIGIPISDSFQQSWSPILCYMFSP